MGNGEITGRPLKILSRFPSFMRTEKPGKAIGSIASALGGDLDEGERLLFRIQRAHRLAVAEEETDLLKLAALLGLHRADFIILRKLYEKGLFASEDEAGTDQEREEAAYRAYLSDLRESIGRIACVMFEGCGTIWALLEGASILINADTTGPAEHTDQDLPRGGFIHRIPVKHPMFESDRKLIKEGLIYLVENPLLDKETEDKEQGQREWFRVKRGGFFDGPVSVRITGVADRCVWPMVINRGTHEGVGFRGVLDDGQELVFGTDGKAYLDGAEVTGKCFYFKGALSDDTDYDGTEPEDRSVLVQPEGAMDRSYPRPLVEPRDRLPVPALRLGESDWRFSVTEGAFDASGFDEAVFAFPEDGSERPASGKVQLRWKEHEPFACRILLPAAVKSLETGLLEGADLRKMVRAGLEKFRAAGIRLDVDYYSDKWILGKSIMRDMDATGGDGIDFEGTIPWDKPY